MFPHVLFVVFCRFEYGYMVLLNISHVPCSVWKSWHFDTSLAQNYEVVHSFNLITLFCFLMHNSCAFC